MRMVYGGVPRSFILILRPQLNSFRFHRHGSEFKSPTLYRFGGLCFFSPKKMSCLSLCLWPPRKKYDDFRFQLKVIPWWTFQGFGRGHEQGGCEAIAGRKTNNCRTVMTLTWQRQRCPLWHHKGRQFIVKNVGINHLFCSWWHKRWWKCQCGGR